MVLPLFTNQNQFWRSDRGSEIPLKVISAPVAGRSLGATARNDDGIQGFATIFFISEILVATKRKK